jgi:predicted enzyme related to lactoylglutathione lyase
MNKQGSDTSSRVTNKIDVPSIDDFSKKIEDKGGKVIQPKMAIP